MKSEHVTFFIGLAIMCLIPIALRWLRFFLKMGLSFVWKKIKSGFKIIARVAWSCIKAPFSRNKFNWRRIFGLRPNKFNLDDVTKDFHGNKRDPRAAGYVFEHFVKAIYSSYGHECYQGRAAKKVIGLYPPQLLETRGDGGVDVITFGKNEINIVQTKLQESAVTGEHITKTAAVRDIFAAYYAKRGDKRIVKAVLITNSYIDNTARMFANTHNVCVYQRDELENMIAKANARIA